MVNRKWKRMETIGEMKAKKELNNTFYIHYYHKKFTFTKSPKKKQFYDTQQIKKYH